MQKACLSFFAVSRETNQNRPLESCQMTAQVKTAALFLAPFFNLLVIAGIVLVMISEKSTLLGHIK
jgi:hypothetical protein